MLRRRSRGLVDLAVSVELAAACEVFVRAMCVVASSGARRSGAPSGLEDRSVTLRSESRVVPGRIYREL
jgi:hypothetical protein